MAGGTDILVKMKKGLIQPKYVVDLKGVPGLDSIVREDGYLKIGSLAKLREVEMNGLVRERFEAVAEAAGAIGSIQVRNLGTIGGNVCNASPAADLAPALLVVGALAKVFGHRGGREVPLEDFFTGVGTTTIEPDELLTEIWLPQPPRRVGSAFEKYSLRKAMDIATVNAAAQIVLDDEGICTSARIAFGAVHPTPKRARRAERALENTKIGDEEIEKASEKALEEISPITDIRGPAWYRRHVAGVLLRRVVKSALTKILG